MSESNTSDREIVITRVLKAPRELVFEAWTRPEHVAQWWGPTGFTTTTAAMEVRVGGSWRFVMHGPDGTDWPNRVDFLEVVRPERLVYDHGDGIESSPHHFRVVVTFEDAGAGRTLLTMRSVFPTREQRDFVVKEVNAIEGGQQTIGRLEVFLETFQPR
ncbi:MAG TPA: SRPBCC family protein [Steroidobacteraceae bacterium]|jgi:uncharacterized protein YndB with AHSA1/START domain